MQWELFKNKGKLFLLLFYKGNLRIYPLANSKTKKNWTKLEIEKKKLEILLNWHGNIEEFIKYIEMQSIVWDQNKAK